MTNNYILFVALLLVYTANALVESWAPSPDANVCYTGFPSAITNIEYTEPNRNLTATSLACMFRDMPVDHPDFSQFTGATNLFEPNIVEIKLGEDGTPTYAGHLTDGTITTTGADAFYEWFHTNTSAPNDHKGLVQLLTSRYGFAIHIAKFYPLDYMYRTLPYEEPEEPTPLSLHSNGFTAHIHTQMEWNAVGTAVMGCDDACWLFINGSLVIDNGGIHRHRLGQVALHTVPTLANLTV